MHQKTRWKICFKDAFDLSHQPLTEHEISVLDKGLKFAPMPQRLLSLTN